MQKNKRRGATLLFCLALGAFFVVKAAGYIREIRDSREAAAQCLSALKGSQPLPMGRLSRLEERLAELRALETTEGKPLPTTQPAEDPAGMIRDALRTHAIRVERLRSLSAGGAAATEFVLTSAPANFLQFLQNAAELPLLLSYVSIKPDLRSSTINVTMRFNHEP
jgi:type II secretory pathway component PulM